MKLKQEMDYQGILFKKSVKRGLMMENIFSED